MGRLTGGDSSLARERAQDGLAHVRESGPEMGWGKGSCGREGGGRAVAAWAGFSPAEGGGFFSFSFYFLIPLSIFLYLFPLNN
jgi:hypothetical protein